MLEIKRKVESARVLETICVPEEYLKDDECKSLLDTIITTLTGDVLSLEDVCIDKPKIVGKYMISANHISDGKIKVEIKILYESSYYVE